MTIAEAESILVIIVSTTLSVFLIISIITLLKLNQLVTSVQRVVDKAERVVETAGEAAAMMKDASGPLAVFKMLRNMVSSADKTHKDKEE